MRGDTGSSGASGQPGWFGRRTFAAHDFDVDDLARRKAAADLSVSVVLPARDEAETIEGMVSACASLAGVLVDELVVMDGASTDDTAALAAAAGARVHRDDEVLPDHGPAQGKGDALWRSLAVTSGDLVVFVDSDIRNPDPRYVWALLGPLLVDPGIALVKAFYDRPLQVGRERHASGGGRVTELTARPLLNLLWPALAGLVQPLSGECAARRRLLEALPFFTGYGVEIGLLIDTLAAVGVDAIAQVDLYERVHRNQDMNALSRMACGIVQVALQRSHRGGDARAVPAATDYVQFLREADGSVRLAPARVTMTERPPIATLA